MSSAGTARDAPKARSTKRTRMEQGPLIQNALPENLGHPPQGVCVSTGGHCASERRENISVQLYCCSTAAAKKNDGDRLAVPKLAETLRIGFCQAL